MRPAFRPTAVAVFASMVALTVASSPTLAADDVAGSLVTFKRNGGWSWFSTSSALVDNGQLLIGSVAGVTNANGTGGDIQVTGYNFASGASSSFVLQSALQQDDHNNPTFVRRPDGRYLSVYQRHGSDDLMRWRVSTNPGSMASWGAASTLDVNPDNNFGNTYSNLFYLPAEGKYYNFSRSVGYDPNYSTSTDGQTFTYGDRWMSFANPVNNNASGGRPYLRYASNNLDTVFFATTDDHPRDYGNSIYAGFVRGGNSFNSAGTQIGPLFTPGVTSVQPSSYTRVYQGDDNHRAWTTDIELDPATGNPVMAYSVREIVGGVTTLKYFYAKWTGSAWVSSPLAFAGNYLYAAENDYTGLVALDPADPNHLYLSTDVDPVTGAAVGTGKHELYEGRSTDDGATWSFTAITSNSTMDNIRPVIPDFGTSGYDGVIWMRGTYTNYTNYNTDVVGLIVVPEPAMLVVAAAPLIVRRRR